MIPTFLILVSGFKSFSAPEHGGWNKLKGRANCLRINISCLVVFTFAFPALLHAQHHIYDSPLQLGPNIPQTGSSVLDKIYSRQDSTGKSTYEIPFPFDRFLRKIGDRSYRPAPTTALPFSRSIQRPVDLSFNPFQEPRLIFSTVANSPEFYDQIQNRFFAAYHRPSDQIEVISYNVEAGRFEFQIIANYSDPERRAVYYAKRSKCVACHQAQGPIFSDAPWTDTTFSKTIRQLVSNEIETPWMRDWVEDDGAFEIDSSVRRASSLIQANRVWVHGCKSKSCRHRLLRLSLGQALYNEQLSDTQTNFLREFSAISIPSSQIPSESFGIIDLFRTHGQGISQDMSLISGIIQSLSELRGPSNPSFPARNRQISIAFNIDVLFSPQDLIILRNMQKADLYTALDLLAEDDMFGPHSFDEKLIMREILSKTSHPAAQSYAVSRRPTPERVLYTVDIQIPVNLPELKTLRKYCGDCHSDPSFPSPFLSYPEEETLLWIKSKKDRLVERIENASMPPGENERRLFTNSGDKQAILNWLKFNDGPRDAE